jgi:AhpD family alkylhydroperoxidase
MQARMNNPALVLPDALQALLAVNKALENKGVPPATNMMVQLRASQINGCSVCVDMHARELKGVGESDDRIFAVEAWRDTPYFTEAERAALALAEAAERS